jgi:hypothetical protein
MQTFLLSTLFFLQATTISTGTTKQPPANQKKLEQEAATAAAATPNKTPAPENSARSLMLIDPKARASDYLKAFEALRQEKATSKVIFELADGSTISNVIDMKLMPEQTLIVFRYNTVQGVKFQVVAIEDLVGIRHP